MNLQDLDKEGSENNREYAYRVLRQNIMCRGLEPGESLNEAMISEQLGISRTPIREALMKLREEQLVDIVPQSSSRVTLIDYNLVQEGIFMRSAIEPFVLKLVHGSLPKQSEAKIAENIELQRIEISRKERRAYDFFALDNEFHKIIYNAAKKSLTWQMMRVGTTHFDRLRLFGAEQLIGRSEWIFEEHVHLFKILLEGSKADLHELVGQHLWNYRQHIEDNDSKRWGNLFVMFPQYFSNVPSSMGPNNLTPK